MTDHPQLLRRDYLAILSTAALASFVPEPLSRSIAENVQGSDGDKLGSQPTGSRPGLSVQNGAFYRSGKPAQALGVNYFDCFSQMLTGNQSRSQQALARCERGFSELKALNIPFVRFNGGGFYPTNWRLHQTNPEAYFDRWDKLVQLAEDYEIGLIPSLFWTFFTQPGIAGEPLSAWGDRTSQTHENMRTYIEEITSRSHDSPAIWAWEFGNEYNLEVDLPNPQQHLKHWYQTSLGMPASPGEQDYLTSEHLHVALTSFGEAIRQHDPHRPILAGHASPRSTAWHLSQNQGWIADSETEWLQALAKQTPEPLDALSLHLYPFHPDGSGRAGDSGLGTLQSARELSLQTQKPLWVGEFGYGPEASSDERLHQYQQMISWLEQTSVGLSAAWVYDFTAQPTHNLSSPENRPLLELIGETNKRWMKSQ